MLKFFIRNWMAGIVSLAWWLSLAGLLDAQGSTREVNFRVLCIQHSQEATTAHAVEAGSGAVIEIPLLTGRMSQPFKGAFSNNTASLFVENEAAAGGRQVIAEGKLASGPQQLFFLVPVPPESKLIYRIIALNDDVATFPMGAVRVLNLCTVPIRLNFAGANMAAIAPGGTASYPPVKAVDEW